MKMFICKDVILKRLINLSMKKGKKTRSQRLVFDSFDILNKNGVESNSLLVRAVENIRPYFYLRPVRVRGRTQQVPAILSESRQINMAIRWLLEGALVKKKKTPKVSFSVHFARELLEAVSKQAIGIRKRQELHRKVDAYRAAARFRWWMK
uniref:Ribosomal protein S7 n=1 Tax=Pyramimonas parkeae TaxID=36894 RepID=A0A1D8I1U3_9CHLO|nr:ribosomal protein S7 [Pyramimonas parkeae]AOT98952.1 ribosomal protein S7 [Pyramimonas parkeae]